MTRYYLAPNGTRVPMTALDDHADVGRRILTDRGIVPKDYSDIYDQMELLGFIRVVEFPERVFAENSKSPATEAQLAYLQERRISDVKERELVINDKLFTETRRGGSLANQSLNEIRSAMPQ